ncbi:MAG: D-glycero-beta-D-manno-heptose-7-phosphate kinase [Elusimicrobia bacterium]|nr:D-glycero-beta-D-manno-heptose-7-phosphate kinase [Elusimicrobiota bacterium]
MIGIKAVHMRGRLSRYVERFPGRRILVVGDLMLDRFLWGEVSRISPEAPVPIVQLVRETYAPGGTGNVVTNLAALGASVTLVGVVGTDPEGQELVRLFERQGVHTEGIVREASWPTIQKSRVIAHHQQLVRLDRELSTGLPPVVQERLLNAVRLCLPTAEVVILSDYGKGVLVPRILRTAIRLAHRQGCPILVDPKVEHFLRYRGVTCVTPNLAEAIGGMHLHRLDGDEDLVKLGQKILKRLGCKAVLITRGEKGMTLFQRQRPVLHIPTRAKEVFDVTGAGDTVISVLALAVAAGAPLTLAAELANEAAGIVVGKLGTATTTREELKAALNHG